MATVVLSTVLAADTARAEDLSGWWSGYWVSCTNGHNGPLRAYFCQLDDGSYQVQFSGRFWKIIPFRYTTVLNVVQDGDVVTLAGDSYLGRLMGSFHYDATATATDFTADYASRQDYGQFIMSRCCRPVCDEAP